MGASGHKVTRWANGWVGCEQVVKKKLELTSVVNKGKYVEPNGKKCFSSPITKFTFSWCALFCSLWLKNQTNHKKMLCSKCFLLPGKAPLEHLGGQRDAAAAAVQKDKQNKASSSSVSTQFMTFFCSFTPPIANTTCKYQLAWGIHSPLSPPPHPPMSPTQVLPLPQDFVSSTNTFQASFDNVLGRFFDVVSNLGVQVLENEY